ncbi:uncharacterized protein LOC112892334 isoform X6 [Panicum hallii]|uniref:uncharacterized protein LOC112892334 isoform X6 n=1 Tax=Panicum hallii TaxID=206008 RepID=UPI000DF4E60C|nr:uncharacterized protein LOC112892334 isoform X6 [Panicum hallii]
MMGGLLSAAHSRQAPRISSDIICRSSAVSAYQESSSGIVGSSWCSSRRPLALPCSHKWTDFVKCDRPETEDGSFCPS